MAHRGMGSWRRAWRRAGRGRRADQAGATSRARAVLALRGCAATVSGGADGAVNAVCDGVGVGTREAGGEANGGFHGGWRGSVPSGGMCAGEGGCSVCMAAGEHSQRRGPGAIF